MRLGLALRHWFRATRRTVSPEGNFSKNKREMNRRSGRRPVSRWDERRSGRRGEQPVLTS
jgi:hypothetical protein